MRKSWATASLSDVSLIFIDGDWIESKDQSPTGIRLIQTGNVGIGEFKDRAEKARYISPETFQRLRCEEIFEGDCLISRLPDPVGRACIIPASGERLITAVDCTIIRFDLKRITPDYFKYFSQSSVYLAEVNAACTGATRKRISRSKLGQVSLPVPSLPEQKHIVAILDEAFEGIDTALANAEKSRASARELFSSYVAAIFEKGDADWLETNIGAEVDLQTGFAFRSPNYTSDLDGVRLLRGDNIVQGELRWEDGKRWPSTDRAAYREYELEENDIVLAMDRTWVKAGIKFARMSRDDVPALLVQRVARMRCRKALSGGLLFHLLGSRLFEKYVLEIQTGLGVPHISGKQIQAFRFKMPSIAAQGRTVEKLDAMRTHCESLVASYQDKIALLNTLKQSILQRAFAGELTARSVGTVQEAAE